ncbi:DUF5667 domain-containing protein [Nocardioides terrisoli]|uniref:DUF5667 domain-containing protein n=1 Tax=Nocardioides terrisoli TaxID=3388267 RepID=UPI00287B9CD7|nr:DUF5667 domain-containing protein [Nocardioides marmorisolisilvae]
MSPQFAARRAAEEFASVIDGPTRSDVADRYADLVGTVMLLREHPQPLPRPEFVTDLRERLMDAADLLPAQPTRLRPSAPARRRPAGWRQRHLGAAAAALVLVGGTAGMAAAAQSALPGQALYPVKRGIEQVEVQMSGNDAARGRQLLVQAGTRLEEVRSLVAEPSEAHATPQLVDQTLAAFTASADQGSDLLFRSYQSGGENDDIAAVRDFTAGHMSALRQLAAHAPSQSSPAFRRAGSAVADIDQQARTLCGACSDRAPVSLPRVLDDMVSARSLTALVTVPTARADQAARAGSRARAEARAAQEAASRSAGTGATTHTPSLSSPGATSTAPPAAGASTPQVGTLGAALPKPSKHPVTDLVKGLTSGVPLANGLGDTLNGVTAPLDDTLNGVGDAVKGLLNPPQG